MTRKVEAHECVICGKLFPLDELADAEQHERDEVSAQAVHLAHVDRPLWVLLEVGEVQAAIWRCEGLLEICIKYIPSGVGWKNTTVQQMMDAARKNEMGFKL